MRPRPVLAHVRLYLAKHLMTIDDFLAVMFYGGVLKRIFITTFKEQNITQAFTCYYY